MRIVKGAFIFFCAVSLLVSCGGEKKKEKENFSYENKSTTTEKEIENRNLANIVLIGDDLMKFDKTEIKAKTGQKVKLTLRHKGKMDVNVMGHNVVILKRGVDITTFAGKAALARDNDYIPVNTEDIIAFTKTIGGGQTTSIEFNAPDPGIYDFICSFPGHYALMKGKFIVE
ncbi:azurin [Seonamhaeicola sediminis]|uniref:Azurin n=1 Tax=Seonamhaeicola sediminis TaxID=2528206 RepID=A0A562YG88_9FLAO|nr:azurin [Seonamhaeicola sediminis]TWO33363.1 azurin [Seonamhaeicola sediminis]